MSFQVHSRVKSELGGVDYGELEQKAGGMQTPNFARWQAAAECEQSHMHAFIAGEASKSSVASTSQGSAIVVVV